MRSTQLEAHLCWTGCAAKKQVVLHLTEAEEALHQAGAVMQVLTEALVVAEVVVHCLTAPLAVEAEELEGQRQHRFDEEEEAGQDHALALEEVVSGKLEEH